MAAQVPPPHPRTGEQGYNLVILTVMVTLLQVAIALALPVWSHANQREKEAELIFRGMQYAEAIRVFQVRFGRYPVRLEELIELEPRSIRQLWPNPMTEDGRWALVIEGGRPGTRENPGGGEKPSADGGRDDQPADGENADPLLSSGQPGEEVRGPIKGVRNPESGAAIKTWFDKSDVGQWVFTTETLQISQPGNQIDQGGTVFRSMNAGVIGRPFPPGVTPQSFNPPTGPGSALDRGNPNGSGGSTRPASGKGSGGG